MTCLECKGKGYIELLYSTQSCDCQKTFDKVIDLKTDEEIDSAIKETLKFFIEKTDLLLNILMDQKWYRNDQLHREDGPAIIRMDGSKE